MKKEQNEASRVLMDWLLRHGLRMRFRGVCTSLLQQGIWHSCRIHATLSRMMNTQSQKRKTQRIALHGLAGVVLASFLLGCATQGTSSQGRSNQGTGGSRVEIYGEIDMGYGSSRTKTTLQHK